MLIKFLGFILLLVFVLIRYSESSSYTERFVCFFSETKNRNIHIHRVTLMPRHADRPTSRQLKVATAAKMTQPLTNRITVQKSGMPHPAEKRFLERMKANM